MTDCFRLSRGVEIMIPNQNLITNFMSLPPLHRDIDAVREWETHINSRESSSAPSVDYDEYKDCPVGGEEEEEEEEEGGSWEWPESATFMLPI